MPEFVRKTDVFLIENEKKMIKSQVRVLSLLAASVAICQIHAATVTVEMRNNFFSPRTVKVL